MNPKQAGHKGGIAARKSGKPLGHWPKGKNRHDLVVNPRSLAAGLRRLSRLPQREAGALIGVHDRTIRRWLDGTHRPAPIHQQLIVKI